MGDEGVRERSRSFGGISRGQTVVLGLVFLIGIAAIVGVGILLVAGETNSSLEQRAEKERVEGAFVELSVQFETASSSQDISRTTDLDLETNYGDTRIVENGEIDVLVGNDSIFGAGEREPIPLRSIEYTAKDGSVVAYQGGGVWRGTGEASMAISKPNVHLRDGSLTLPVPFVHSSTHSSSGSVSMTGVGTDVRHSGHVTDGPVVVEVTTPYYGGWERYFESLGVGNVSVEPAPGTDTLKTVVATYEVEETEPPSESVDIVNNFDRAVTIEGGIDTSSGGVIEGDVVASEDSIVNMGVDGDVVVDGDVTISDDGGAITGDVISSGTVTVKDEIGGTVVAGGDVIVTDETNEIGGHVVAGGDVEIDSFRLGEDVISDGEIVVGPNFYEHEALYAGGEIGHTTDSEYCEDGCADHYPNYSDVDGLVHAQLGSSIDVYVENQLPDRFEPLDETIAEWIDETEEEFVDIDEGDGPLTHGTYYAESVSVAAGDELTVDVGDGDVDVLVRGDVTIAGDVRVENPDSGVVRFWLANDFNMIGGPSICPAPDTCPETDESDANVIQLYGTSTSEFSFTGEPTIHGLIYAPQGEYEDDNVVFTGSGNVDFFGAIVAGGFDSNGQLKITHDENLAERYESPFLGQNGEETPNDGGLQYLHVTVHHVTVENE